MPTIFDTYDNMGYIPGVVTTADRRPEFKQWDMRQFVFEQSILQRTPINSFLRRVGNKKTTDTHRFYWSSEVFEGWRGDVADVYTNSGLSSAYSSGGVVGTMLFFAVTANDAKKIQMGDVIVVIDSAGAQRPVDVVASVVGDDSTSYFVAKLMAADTGNALAGTGLTWRAAGNASEENSGLPNGVMIEPRLYENCTQIIKGAYEASGTELAEKEKIDPKFKARQKKKAWQKWMVNRERAFLLGPYKPDGVGPNGKPKRHTRGIYNAMKTYVSSNFFDFSTDASFDGKNWTASDGGIKFLFEKLEILSRYSETKHAPALIGSLGLLAINEAVRANGQYQISDATDNFGFRVKRLTGLNITIDFHQAPLFIDDPAFRRSMLIFEPENLAERPLVGREKLYIDGTNNDGHDWVDGMKEGFVCETGLQWDNLEAFGWFDNLGLNNAP